QGGDCVGAWQRDHRQRLSATRGTRSTQRGLAVSSIALRRVLAVLMLLLIAGCSVAVYLLSLGSAELAPLGYLAVFVTTLVGGMAIMVPGVNVVVLVA